MDAWQAVLLVAYITHVSAANSLVIAAVFVGKSKREETEGRRSTRREEEIRKKERRLKVIEEY